MSNEKKYFDLQVNGYAGIDFNSITLTEEKLKLACEKLEEDNVEGILATIITDDFEKMITKISKVANLIDQNYKINSVIKGIHLEGPFINSTEGYRGAHPEKFIIPADLDMLKILLEKGKGYIKIITLAPETDYKFKLTKYLTDNNIVVSAGHSNATLQELNGAIDNGLKLFTHLGNGSPSMLPRHDNIVNRVISLAGEIKICFIADGIHMPLFALKNYIKATGVDNTIIVTDCIAAASAPPGRYSVSHIQVEVSEDKIVREIGKENLAGSAITMKETEIILRDKCGFSNNSINKLLKENSKSILSK